MRVQITRNMIAKTRTGLWRDADLRRNHEKEAPTERPHCKGETDMRAKIVEKHAYKNEHGTVAKRRSTSKSWKIGTHGSARD